MHRGSCYTSCSLSLSIYTIIINYTIIVITYSALHNIHNNMHYMAWVAVRPLGLSPDATLRGGELQRDGARLRRATPSLRGDAAQRSAGACCLPRVLRGAQRRPQDRPAGVWP